jgi:hypothetical protein
MDTVERGVLFVELLIEIAVTIERVAELRSIRAGWRTLGRNQP